MKLQFENLVSCETRLVGLMQICLAAFVQFMLVKRVSLKSIGPEEFTVINDPAALSARKEANIHEETVVDAEDVETTQIKAVVEENVKLVELQEVIIRFPETDTSG